MTVYLVNSRVTCPLESESSARAGSSFSRARLHPTSYQSEDPNEVDLRGLRTRLRAHGLASAERPYRCGACGACRCAPSRTPNSLSISPVSLYRWGEMRIESPRMLTKTPDDRRTDGSSSGMPSAFRIPIMCAQRSAFGRTEYPAPAASCAAFSVNRERALWIRATPQERTRSRAVIAIGASTN